MSSSVSERLQLDDTGPATINELGDAITMIGRLAGALRQATESASAIMQMERTVAGEPRNFQPVQAQGEAPPMTMDEVERRIEAGLRALARAKAKGINIAAAPAPGT